MTMNLPKHCLPMEETSEINKTGRKIFRTFVTCALIWSYGRHQELSQLLQETPPSNIVVVASCCGDAFSQQERNSNQSQQKILWS